MRGGVVLWPTLYVIAAVIGRATRPEDSPIALVWPAAGVAVLWLLYTPVRYRLLAVAALAVLSTTINLVTGAPTPGALALGAANVVHAAVAVAILEWTPRDVARKVPRLRAIGDLYRLGLAALAGGVASAPFGVLVWVILGQDVRVASALGAWVLRYAVISAVVIAVALAWRQKHSVADFAAHAPRTLEVAVATIVGVASYSAVFLSTPGRPFDFLAVPVAVWVGVRLGPLLTAVHGLLVTALCVAATQAGRGPFGGIANPVERSVLVQSFVAVVAVVGLALSMTVQDRRRALESAAAGRRRLGHVLDSALLGQAVVSLSDNDSGRIVYANPALRDLTHTDPVGDCWLDFVARQDRSMAEGALASLQRGEAEWHGLIRHESAEGPRWHEVSLAMLPQAENGDSPPPEAYLQLLDVTEKREFADLLSHQALHDDLTGLPKRALLRDRLDHALASSQRNGLGVALVFIDIDHFKTVNDSLGHETGDIVIVELGRRLQAAVRPGDTVARIGGDEFVVCCVNLTDEDQASVIANRLVRAVSSPVVLPGREINVSVSAGVALADGFSDPDALLRDSDMAMYEAKNRGRGRVEFFQQELHERAQRRLELSGQVRDALRSSDLVLHYQPLVELGTSRIVALEALVRWQHPQRGLLMPGEWLDVAEGTDLMVQLGTWALRTAVTDFAWMQNGHDLRVHVNISASQLREPGLIETVTSAVESAGINPKRLVLEITETQLLTVHEDVLRDLQGLRNLGVILSVDDFGTGYSSLSRLTTLPVEELKIDKSFVLSMDSDPRSRAVVQAVIGMASAMELDVVAEGVERPAIAEDLTDLGCKVAQGFLWSPAVPREEIEPMLAGMRA
jgi:diguanylate cyclase (GGDEF)-like protein